MSERDGSDEAPPDSVAVATGGLTWTRVRLPWLLSTVAKGFYGGAAVATVVSALVALAFEGDRSSLLSALFSTASAVAYPLWVLSYVFSLTQTTFAGSLEVTPGWLAVKGGGKGTMISRRDVVGALVVSRRVGDGVAQSVEIELANGDRLTARLPDPAAGRAIVEKLGFGRGGRRVVVRLAKPTRRLVHLVFAVVAWLVGMMVYGGFLFLDSGRSARHLYLVGAGIYPLVALGLYELLRRANRAGEVAVGSEGAVVRRGLRTTRVDLRADVSGIAGGEGLDLERLAAVHRIMRERVSPSNATPERLALFARDGRGLSEWRAALEQAASPTNYRVAAVSADEAAGVLGSLEASPEQRVGAALALRAAGAPLERIRVAADAVADDDLREALEAVAQSDDDRAEKAVFRLAARG